MRGTTYTSSWKLYCGSRKEGLMKLRDLLFVTFLVVGFAFASTAIAKDIYVNRNTGSNSNPGTKSEPQKLLWKVMKNLQSGDHIFVSEGHYTGKSKSGVMPKCTVGDVIIEGGWKSDFSERNPFKYITKIAPPADRQGAGVECFKFESPTGRLSNVVIDGFCIDRGPHNYYFADGEPGARKRIEGHKDNTCWGYRSMNKGKSGSDPTIELIGKGTFAVRNCILVNNAWWGIYIKGGGTGEIAIENNLIFISQGRAIEALTGGGWGKPDFSIKNNTIIFNNTMKTTEGNAMTIDPRKSLGKYVIENNLLAYSDGGGFNYKFGTDHVFVNRNKFFFNRRGDACYGGSAVANADEFEDELECDNEENVHSIPDLTKLVGKAWLDRWSSREDPSLIAGNMNSEADLMAARAKVGLKEYSLPGYDKSFASYKDLPDSRNGYTMSRYPHPMKVGEEMSFAKWVFPLIGAEGKYGIQSFEGKEVLTKARDLESGGSSNAATVKMKVQFNSELLGKLEKKAKEESTTVEELIEKAVATYLK